MTSTVTVEAHCGHNKVVRVQVIDDSGLVEELTLEDGEKADRYIYDDRSVIAVEVPKDS